MRDILWRSAMINKLKRKFIILATVSILLLMTVLVGVMNLINYSVVVKESDAVLDVLALPDNPFFNKGDHPEKPDDIGGDDKGAGGKFVPHGMSPEVPYESRFFSVTVASDGTIKESDFSRILSVDSTSAGKYIEKAQSGGERGFVGQFRYAKVERNGETRIFFLDCGRKLDSFHSFLRTSLCVGLLGCVVVFIAFIFVSGRIVKPIAESYEKQKRFVSDAGHEMKTPLTIINANLDLLDGEAGKEELDEIRTQTRRMTELTNNLVYLSKMEESEHKTAMVEMPLSDIVGETVNSFHTLTASKNIEMSADIAGGITAKGSPDAIRRLASILLENAVKYSPDGGKITVTLSQNKKNATLSVYNTTETEIDKATLPYVFDRFYRTDASRNSETGGHGIGLSIAKAIVTVHGGSISASTESGRDFRITAVIPL